MPKAKPRKSKAREIELIAELQAIYGYMLLKEKTKKEQFSTGFRSGRWSGKKMSFTPYVIMRLGVPATSAIGKQMAALYAEKRR